MPIFVLLDYTGEANHEELSIKRLIKFILNNGPTFHSLFFIIHRSLMPLADVVRILVFYNEHMMERDARNKLSPNLNNLRKIISNNTLSVT